MPAPRTRRLERRRRPPREQGGRGQRAVGVVVAPGALAFLARSRTRVYVRARPKLRSRWSSQRSVTTAGRGKAGMLRNASGRALRALLLTTAIGALGPAAI